MSLNPGMNKSMNNLVLSALASNKTHIYARTRVWTRTYTFNYYLDVSRAKSSLFKTTAEHHIL